MTIKNAGVLLIFGMLFSQFSSYSIFLDPFKGGTLKSIVRNISCVEFVVFIPAYTIHTVCVHRYIYISISYVHIYIYHT